MNYSNKIILVLLALITSFCSEKKGNKEVISTLENHYESIATIQKKLDNEQASFLEEKDTLMNKLRLSKGALDTSVELFNDKYRTFLEKQSQLVLQHNNILGGIAELQDEVTNGDISEEEALTQNEELLEQQKLVLETYNTFLKTRDSLMVEYDALQKGETALLK